jgi:hypothetical protein
MERNQRPEKMREQMEHDGSLSQLELEIRQEKCIAKMLESAKIIEKEPETAEPQSEKAPKKKAAAKKPVRKKKEEE